MCLGHIVHKKRNNDKCLHDLSVPAVLYVRGNVGSILYKSKDLSLTIPQPLVIIQYFFPQNVLL